MAEEIKTTIGDTVITFDVCCPCCNEDLSRQFNYEWFEKTMGVDFPSVGTERDFEAVCPVCEKEFIIKGFDNIVHM